MGAVNDNAVSRKQRMRENRQSSARRLGRPALGSTERVNLELVKASLGVSGMCRRRDRCQCHLGGVSKGRGSPWERGDEYRRSESTQEDCWMKQAGYLYVSHTLLSCACAQNVPGTESWS